MERAYRHIEIHLERIPGPGGDRFEVGMVIGLMAEVDTALASEVDRLLAQDLHAEAVERLLNTNLPWGTCPMRPVYMLTRWGNRPQRVAPSDN